MRFEKVLGKTWTAIDRLTTIGKFDPDDKIEQEFFQAVNVSVLLYGYTSWILTKREKEKLYWNYTRMLRAIYDKSRK